MNRRILVGIGIVVVVALVILAGSVFTVHQTQQALVLQFGNPVRVVKEPGLNFKLPLIQQVERYERRVLDYDAEQVELILGDQKRLLVDAFARYRIEDPLRFRQSVSSERDFLGRLEPIIYSSLRSVMGEVSLFTVLSEDRTALMARIQEEANRALGQFGVKLVDVRIKRADLPPENSQAIFRRMQTEREREAKELRAQGAEIAQRIRARADRERRVLIAEAQRDAEIARGQGDAQAIAIFAEAFGQDVDFFKFYRSLQAYRKALGDDRTSLVLSPDSEFFAYFRNIDELDTTAGSNVPASVPATAPSDAADDGEAEPAAVPANDDVAPDDDDAAGAAGQ